MSATDLDRAKPRRYLALREMAWPNPQACGDLDWRLRYAKESITRGDQLVLASITSAYVELITCTAKKRASVVRQIKEAMKK